MSFKSFGGDKKYITQVVRLEDIEVKLFVMATVQC